MNKKHELTFDDVLSVLRPKSDPDAIMAVNEYVYGLMDRLDDVEKRLTMLEGGKLFQ